MFRHSLRQAIPSMFHRRLLLLAVLSAAAMGGLCLRAATMTTGATHKGRRQQVEGALVRTRYAPTKRGRILDRNGVVLAEDRPGWNIAVHYSVLSGAWVKQAARRAARADAAWREASDDEREALLGKYQGECAGRLSEFWKRLAGAAHVDVHDLFEKQDAVVRRVSAMREAQLRALFERALREKGEADWETISKSFSLPEEDDHGRGHDYHPILTDVGDADRMAVQDILDEPEDDGPAPDPAAAKAPPTLWEKLGLVPRQAATPARSAAAHDTPWNKVELQLVRARRYPCETAKIAFDRSTLPAPLRNAKPLELTVRGIGMHVLGYTRRATDWVPTGKDGRPVPGAKSELGSHPFRTKLEDGTLGLDLHGLMPGDLVGSMGIEKSFEEALRGTRGEIQIRKSASTLAESRRREPVPGHDVQLSLDIKLQTRVEAAMSREVGLMEIHTEFQPWSDGNYYPPRGVDKEGKPHFKPDSRYGGYADLGKGRLNGAAVVLDAASGEVLAAVSSPGIPLEDLQEKIGALWADQVDEPMADRVAGRDVLPGSIMKPLVLSAAISEGVYQPGEIVDIPGYPWVKDPHAYRDFAYVHSTPHTPLGPHELAYAIAVSSSPPFVMLAQTREDRSGKPRLGPARTLDWYDRFGFGHAPDAGIPAKGGKLGFNHGPTPDKDACLVAMGQGDAILATPLQVGIAYVRFLGRDFGLSSTFLKRPSGWHPQQAKSDKRVSQEALDYVLKGMWMATHMPGGTMVATRNYPDVFDCPGVSVWGKSGTAQTWPQLVDSDGDKKLTVKETVIRAGDHGWAVTLCAPAGDKYPRFIIVTMLEYGGSGGRAAGPIANQVIHALKAEGYLEKIPKAQAAPVVVNPALSHSIENATAGEEATPAADTPPPVPVRDPSDEGDVL